MAKIVAMGHGPTFYVLPFSNRMRIHVDKNNNECSVKLCKLLEVWEAKPQ